MLGQPEDGLARAADQETEPRRQVVLGPRGRGPVALGQLGSAAAAVEADRGQHHNRRPRRLSVSVKSTQEALFPGSTSRSIRTVAWAVSRRTSRPTVASRPRCRGGVWAPLGVPCRPAPQPCSAGHLLQPSYCVVKRGIWHGTQAGPTGHAGLPGPSQRRAFRMRGPPPCDSNAASHGEGISRRRCGYLAWAHTRTLVRASSPFDDQ